MLQKFLLFHSCVLRACNYLFLTTNYKKGFALLCLPFPTKSSPRDVHPAVFITAFIFILFYCRFILTTATFARGISSATWVPSDEVGRTPVDFTQASQDIKCREIKHNEHEIILPGLDPRHEKERVSWTRSDERMKEKKNEGEAEGERTAHESKDN